MSSARQKLELTWIGKENRPKLEPRILIEDSEKSYHASFRTAGNRQDAKDGRNGEKAPCEDFFDNRLIFGENLRDLKGRRNTKRRELFDAQDAIDRQREELIGRSRGS